MYYRLKEITEKTAIIVQKEFDNHRYYLPFKSYISFYNYYLASNNKHYYEIIKENADQKFRLDLETINPEITNKKWNAYIDIITHLASDYLQTDYILRYDSIDPNNKKKSAHIIFPYVYTKNNINSRRILIEITFLLKHYLPLDKYNQITQIIDYSVYKKIQGFRIEGSTKYNQSRYKYIHCENKISDYFFDGLICCIDYEKARVITEDHFKFNIEKSFIVPNNNKSPNYCF